MGILLEELTPNPKPQKPARDRAYLNFVRSGECLACETSERSQAAHVRMGHKGGMGQKPSDYRTLPLCHRCHSRQHQIGEESFWAELGKNPLFLILCRLSYYVTDKHAAIDALEMLIRRQMVRR